MLKLLQQPLDARPYGQYRARIEGVDLDDPQQYSSRHLFNASYLLEESLDGLYAAQSHDLQGFHRECPPFSLPATFGQWPNTEADPEVSEYGTWLGNPYHTKTFVVGVELKF